VKRIIQVIDCMDSALRLAEGGIERPELGGATNGAKSK
jgi:hypothetical protein